MAEPATFADQTLSELLASVAAQTPAPGGGSSAAVACGLAAGLVEMSARFTLAREAYRAHHDRARAIAGRAGRLREEAVVLAEHELTAFEPVLVVLRDPDAPGRAERLKDALSEAAE